ncbi:zinc-dependent alcohol dehydrogenase [Chondromyces apiculatus]|uniref:Threonine dehydrogenase and Zn-dependent dehydrogenase n=1 Tax=Chondromyces apiculatus DSM 436 TaxID=1192034 RepID=A0A017TAV8_9BACT|nr:zinc-dependent alcohol dehydrogenase [Chondromyces apiculatus]EYF06374.1 Threonine dehydrogenase and Zn-dependent dehydrogenase [Chondromyces apiculatus DSM 436]
MKALVFHRPKHVSVDNVDDPRIEHPRDVILKVTATAICGSDLHIYNGLFPQPRSMTLGHEFMGIVEEVGADITTLKRGDRVVVPFPIACGQCFFCAHHLPPHCQNSNPKHYGPEGGLLTEKGGALFGYTDLYGGYDGGQAEYVRVPYADVGPRKVPDGLSDEQVLFLTDILPTGWTAVDQAQLKGGETVAVFGCGPVGLMAMKSAWIKGAGRVIGVDIEEYRVETARRASKAEGINGAKDDPVEAIRAMTEGRGADVCIDAVGMEARRSIWKKLANVIHGQVGSIEVLETCFSAVRRGGMVSVVGVYGMPYDNFPIGQFFDKGLRMWAGQALAQNYVDELMELIRTGKLRTDDIITHRLPLAEAPHGYEIFNKKEDDCVKVVLKP